MKTVYFSDTGGAATFNTITTNENVDNGG